MKRLKQDDRYFVGGDCSNLSLGCRRISHASCSESVIGHVSSLGEKRWSGGAPCGRSPWGKGIADDVLEDKSYERLEGRFGSVEMQDKRLEGTMVKRGRPGHWSCAW